LILVAKAVAMVVPFVFKAVIDRMGAAAPAAVVVALAFGYAGARFAGTLFDNLRQGVFEIVGKRAVAALSANLFDHLQTLGLRYHVERQTGVVGRVVDRGTKSIDSMLFFLLFNIAPTAIEFIAVGIIFLVKFGWWFVGALALSLAGYVALTRYLTDRRAALRRTMLDLDAAVAHQAHEALLNYETVKAFGAEQWESQRYRGALDSYARAATRNEQTLAVLNVGQALVMNATLAAAMAITVWGWNRGRLSIGDLVLVNALLLQLFAPLDMLGAVYRELRQGLVDMEQMFALLDTPAEIVDAPGAPALILKKGSVAFRDVHFGYGPDRPILRGIDFEVPGGATVAVVGPSGAGKSTIARLLYRYYDVTSGAIEIDGQDIRSVTQASLRQAIGIVPQDTILFNETLAYNIAYGRRGATPEETGAAARAAALDGFVAALPDGYDSRVGDRGLKLSGGERQRVAIARTLLKDPPLLILDEATSALDSRTEASIQQALAGLARYRTTLVIAHRLSTIVGADEILVLSEGRIVERGHHSALLRAGGLYAALWAEQARGSDRPPLSPAGG